MIRASISGLMCSAAELEEEIREIRIERVIDSRRVRGMISSYFGFKRE
jgi:hypothetical protein